MAGALYVKMEHRVSELVQVHPSTLATDPSGQQVTVDLEILSLVSAVWGRGWSTLASCQNMGEGIRAGGAPGGERAAAFFDGYAWLKMPFWAKLRWMHHST